MNRSSLLLLVWTWLSFSRLILGEEDIVSAEKPLTSESEKASVEGKRDDESDDLHPLPYILTSRDFGRHISDTNVWLYVFMIHENSFFL